MDGQQCDRHPSAMAKARILFPNLCTLYMCGHCVDQFSRTYTGQFHVTYQAITINA